MLPRRQPSIFDGIGHSATNLEIPATDLLCLEIVQAGRTMPGSKANWDIGKGSAESFRNISSEVLSLHAVLKESEETLLVPPPSPTREAHLRVVLEGCTSVLDDLQALVKKYEGFGSKSKVTWERMRWCKEDITEIRLRLTSNVALLTALIR